MPKKAKNRRLNVYFGDENIYKEIEKMAEIEMRKLSSMAVALIKRGLEASK